MRAASPCKTDEEQRASPVRFRKLRIACSAVWAITAVLMCLLWLRSYRWNDHRSIRISPPDATGHQSMVGIGSNWGFLYNYHTRTVERGMWRHSKQPAWERTDVGFEWGGIDRIKVPDLFPFLMAVFCGVAPWIHWSKRF